ncbi:MAG: UbiA family prenyltransferase [Bacteroidota bacterium]
MWAQLLFWLKVSRPGLWFATVWLYVLPTSQMEVAHSVPFWFGFFYVCFPLNFLVYGWNDIVDREVDAQNPRKDSFLFGAGGRLEQLKELWKPILVVQLLTYPFLLWWGGWPMLLLLILLLIINALYNWPDKGLRSSPPWELLCQFGYILIVPLSMVLNQTPLLPWPTFVYLLLFAVQSHLMGEVMDVEPDRRSGRRTTATQIGVRKTKLLIIAIVLTEVLILFWVFEEYIFGGMLALGLLWLLLDLFIIFKTKQYTLWQMQLFGVMSNVVAVASMTYVWYSGCLLAI